MAILLNTLVELAADVLEEALITDIPEDSLVRAGSVREGRFLSNPVVKRVVIEIFYNDIRDDSYVDMLATGYEAGDVGMNMGMRPWEIGSVNMLYWRKFTASIQIFLLRRSADESRRAALEVYKRASYALQHMDMPGQGDLGETAHRVMVTDGRMAEAAKDQNVWHGHVHFQFLTECA